jgi:hypothetical protein
MWVGNWEGDKCVLWFEVLTIFSGVEEELFYIKKQLIVFIYQFHLFLGYLLNTRQVKEVVVQVDVTTIHIKDTSKIVNTSNHKTHLSPSQLPTHIQFYCIRFA